MFPLVLRKLITGPILSGKANEVEHQGLLAGLLVGAMARLRLNSPQGAFEAQALHAGISAEVHRPLRRHMALLKNRRRCPETAVFFFGFFVTNQKGQPKSILRTPPKKKHIFLVSGAWPARKPCMLTHAISFRYLRQERLEGGTSDLRQSRIPGKKGKVPLERCSFSPDS